MSARLVAGGSQCSGAAGRGGKPPERRRIPAVTGFPPTRQSRSCSRSGIVTFNHLLHERLPYDPKELVPVAPVIDNFLGVSASAVLKLDTLADLVQAAKAQPGKLNWAATPGLPYYVLLALQKSAGIDMVQVAYRDFAPAYQDLNQGRLHVAGTGVPTLVPHHRAGTAKMLFVTNRERSAGVDVPTAAEPASRPHPDGFCIYGCATGRDRARIATDTRAIIATRLPRADRRRHAPRLGTPEEFARGDEEQRARSRRSIRATRSPVNVAPAPPNGYPTERKTKKSLPGRIR